MQTKLDGSFLELHKTNYELITLLLLHKSGGFIIEPHVFPVVHFCLKEKNEHQVTTY